MPVFSLGGSPEARFLSHLVKQWSGVSDASDSSSAALADMASNYMCLGSRMWVEVA